MRSEPVANAESHRVARLPVGAVVVVTHVDGIHVGALAQVVVVTQRQDGVLAAAARKMPARGRWP